MENNLEKKEKDWQIDVKKIQEILDGKSFEYAETVLGIVIRGLKNKAILNFSKNENNQSDKDL